MPAIKYKYREKQSKIFGTVLRPLVDIGIWSKINNDWEIIDNVLADTGADISILPRFLAEPLVKDITTGQYIEIKGVVPNTVLIAFIHPARIRINEREFETKVAFADSNDVPPILGRYEGLDLFEVIYDRGKDIIINY